MCVSLNGLLWGGNISGAVLSLVLLAGAVLWWGFALPIQHIFAVAENTLILLGWPALS